MWGNVVDSRIQIAPGGSLTLADLLTEDKVTLPAKLKSVLDPSQQLKTVKPKPVALADLQGMYKAANVPVHRYAFADLQKLIQYPTAAPSTSVPGSHNTLNALNVNIGEVLGSLEATQGDTSATAAELRRPRHQQERPRRYLHNQTSGGVLGKPLHCRESGVCRLLGRLGQRGLDLHRDILC